MELLNRLTLKNLKLNKKRTLVTIIGIVLATALITGVATLVSSFQKSILEFEKQTSGDYHYSFKNVPGEDLKYIENNRNVESVFVTCGIGYSKLDEVKNDYKPYIYVSAFSKEAMKKLGLELFDGRLPENENQIAIGRHLQTNGQVDFKIGEEITLDIGKRIADGNELNQGNPYNASNEESEEMLEDEEFKKEFQKTYKIVGIIERPNMNVENYSAPGYTAITYLNEIPTNKKIDVYARYKDLKKQNETTETILGIEKGTIDRIESGKEEINFKDLQAVKNAKYEMNKNTSVIQWENAEFGEGTTKMLLTVAGVVIGIIIVTSVFCIRNSFAISITEKTKQYGMLASIGATPKQIRKNVLYEGFVLGAIGIPLGIISGLGAIFILLKVVENLLKDIMNIKLLFQQT